MHVFKGHRLAVIAITTLFAGCKPGVTTSSDVQSLDNLAGAKTINACSGNYAPIAGASIQASDAHVADVNQALSAIPTSMQTAFFQDMRGSIIVSSDLSACRGKDSISCWASPTDDSVAIYVKAESDPAKTTQNIRHALVRSFGYLTAQLILKVNQTEQGTVLTDTPELRAFKSDLVMSLLDDVVKSPKYALKAFKGSLSGKLLDERSKASERRVAWDRIASSVEGQAFADTVLAESFDSYYCSQASRLVMKNDFSGAYAHMVDYAGTLEKLFSGQLDAEIAATHGEADSLSLWFPGRGIIRGAAAIGRGWGNWRASGRGFFNFRRAQQGGGFIFNRGGLFSRWD